MDELVRRIREQVLGRMDLSRDTTDEEISNLIGEETARLTQGISLTLHERMQLEKRVFNSLRKLDALQELLDDPEVSEVMVNGSSHIFYEKAGEVHPWNQCFATEEKMQDVIQQIVGRHNRVVNLSNPIVDTRLEDGSRVNIVLSPIAIDGSAITIRKFPERPLDMEALIKRGTLHEEAAELLQCLVKARYSILVSGGTSSGKTTFLNALSQYIPENERVITIEDSAELQIQGVPNLVRLETRNANMEGVVPVTIRDLIRTALRMRPEGIKIKKGKSEHNKKSFPIPLAFLQYIPGNSIPLISGKIIKIIKEADDLIPLFHSILIFHSSSPLFSRLAGHFSLQVIVFTI